LPDGFVRFSEGSWHGDLKTKNILLRAGGERAESSEGHPILGFIDLDRLGHCPRWLPKGAALWQALDLRRLATHLRECSADERSLLVAEYFRARGFGPLRRWLWAFVVRFPRKRVTRHDRAAARCRGSEIPRGGNRLVTLLKRVFSSSVQG